MKPLLKALALILGLMPLISSAQLVNGTYNVTEDWSVTLDYSDFADTYTGVQHFSGTQSGTIVIQNGEYTMIDRTGIQWAAPGETLLERSIRGSGGSYHISGDYAFAPGFAAKAYGLVFLGCFAVKVPLVDGEIPAFFSYRYYSADGDLDSMDGGGYMRGSSLDATVSSTISLTKVVGPPTIIQQPQSLTVFAGQDATFSVTAGGDGPLSFTWRKGTAVLTGQTGASLTVTNAQSTDATDYSVTVGNSGGSVTSTKARLTVTPPPPAWVESWESASFGTRAPATNGDTFISADKGPWHLGDTAANFPDCWPDANHAEIVTEGSRKLLKLVSTPGAGDCAENIWVAIDGQLGSSFPIPLLRSTEISCFEQGAMVNPQWNGLFGCITPPCGDVVNLEVVDDRGNRVVYIFQRAPNYVEHAITNHLTGGYLEVFLNPAGGTFARNLFNDLARVAGANVGKSILSVEFSLGAEGWAMLDDLKIGSPTPPENVLPTVVISSPANAARVLNPVVVMNGTASDNVAVARVEWSLNGSSFQAATGTINWSATLNLAPGVNNIQVRAIDASGNISTIANRSLTYVLSATAEIQTTAGGAVTPNYNGQLLEIGKSYTLKVKAAKGFTFTGWTGSLTSTVATLSFVMQPGLKLTANFQDITKPTFKVLSPKNKAKLTTALVSVTGTAADNGTLAAVKCQLNDGAWVTAIGTTNWQVALQLVSGVNTIKVYAVDVAGNVSTVTTISVTSTATGARPIENLTPVGAPFLSISLEGDEARLSWPTEAAGFSLEFTETLEPSAGWTTITNAPVVVNGRNVVTDKLRGSAKYYRLAK